MSVESLHKGGKTNGGGGGGVISTPASNFKLLSDQGSLSYITSRYYESSVRIELVKPLTP